jgi:EAL domain-containing protein (putative c-di-GMP-specific phosphodiesterase class I)
MPSSYPQPLNERQRLLKLLDYDLFNTEPDPILDRYVALAAEVAGTPLAFYNLVGETQQLSKAKFGATIDFTPREESFCTYTINEPRAPLIVNDLTCDERFQNSNFVKGDAGLRFYAGFPVDRDEISAVGALCVADITPRSLTDAQVMALETLSISIENHIAFRKLKTRWEALQNIGSTQNRDLNDELSIERQIQKGMSIVELERAIEKREFVNFYQPKIDLGSQEIHGVEALVRWNHPIRGIVQPHEFIPLLEDTGLIIDVGMQVIEQAIEDYKQWSDNGLLPPQIAVNVASLQFTDPNFVEKVSKVVLNSGYWASDLLSIEITESSLISNMESVVVALHALKEIGVSIAMDDFGTGYSSLAIFATLPIDILKIDRSFVMKMSSDPKYMGLVTTIINMAHSLKMQVVAEGVETEEEAKLLRLLRCEYAQGYLYSKPIPSSELMKMLSKNTKAMLTE